MNDPKKDNIHHEVCSLGGMTSTKTTKPGVLPNLYLLYLPPNLHRQHPSMPIPHRFLQRKFTIVRTVLSFFSFVFDVDNKYGLYLSAMLPSFAWFVSGLLVFSKRRPLSRSLSLSCHLLIPNATVIPKLRVHWKPFPKPRQRKMQRRSFKEDFVPP